ncbi:UNVERIFIED_CONTAM: Phosphate transporter [Sesamum radiatum]|uniref:Phosphate transporter n=1 Tax=Sesamum radiatum TaxID=300843 RepID=A0AAW2QGG6_SESRA
MVKFSKELEAQLIPEWKDAFVNYWQLKKHVKKIKLARKPKHVPGSNCDFGRSVFDPVRFLVGRILEERRTPEINPISFSLDLIRLKCNIFSM